MNMWHVGKMNFGLVISGYESYHLEALYLGWIILFIQVSVYSPIKHGIYLTISPLA